MAVDIPEIDGPDHKGLLRTRWFPLVMSDPACFQVVMLLAASHLYSVQNTPNVSVDLLQLKEGAIKAINEGLEDPEREGSDALVGAVAKMASYEAMYGNEESYRVHMRGLQHMVERRGGLAELGLEGLLRRICLWIDLNSAHLNGTERFFEGTLEGEEVVEEGQGDEPNPGQFVGSWN